MQVWLPASMKANTQEEGADVKVSGVFSGTSNLGDGRLMSQSPSPHLSGGRGVYKEGEVNRAKRSREGFEELSIHRPT